jgi:hypothetical protein
MPPTPASSTSYSKDRTRIAASDAIRRRALERLYERKAVLEQLIDSLENYQRCRNRQLALCIPFSAGRKYS